MSTTVKEQAMRADRPGRGLPYDKLVGIKTIDASITSFALRRFELIIQAAEKYRTEITKIDPEMIDYMRALKSVTYSFAFARELIQQSRVSMVWSLRPGDYEKYISPWVQDIDVSWVADYENPYDEGLARNESKMTYKERFLKTAHGYSIETFDTLRNAFLVWASPLIADIERDVEDVVGVIPKAILDTIMVGKKE